MRYVIEERHGERWEPATLPVSPFTDDVREALGILRALSSRRFRVRDTRPDLALEEDRARKRRDARVRGSMLAALALGAIPAKRRARARGAR